MFHFGYAYVGESDVGTQTAVLLCMMGLEKTTGLTVGDVQTTNGCGQAIADVENNIVHRGTSSPLILEAMRSGGPEYLDAVTTYEKNVIGFNRANQDNLREPLVAVYPQDGTVIADHTFAIMDRAPWVTEDQVKAAEMFRQFLFTTAQQELLLGYGLRPADRSVKLGPPIDTASGANPAANLATLQAPDVLVVDQVVDIWKDVKKPANIVLVFDKSGSMQGEKITQAVNGAAEFVGEMDRKDWLFWLPFDGEVYPGIQGLNSEIGEQLQIDIRSTTARGGTALNDAIARAHQILEERRKVQGDTARYGIVVLSNGQDGNSKTTLPVLEEMMRSTEGDRAGIQVHTIGIGEDADDQALTKIAGFTNGGRYWKVKDPSTIAAVYKRISKYW
jgi:Ca-activated chloride channel family protein